MARKFDTADLITVDKKGRWRLPDMKQLGPAMRALVPRQQAFVDCYLNHGIATRAYLEAGYSGDQKYIKQEAYRLLHQDNVQAALQEQCRKRIVTTGPMTIGALEEIANPDNAGSYAAKDRLRAIELLMNRGGLHATSEHKVTVEHKPDAAMLLKRLEAVGKTYGLDVSPLMAKFGGALLTGPTQDVEDAEFEDLDDDLGDLLK